MIFYIATDPTGLKHCLTVEAEAKKIDKNYVTIDQPNDKASLKTLIQESFNTIHNLEQQISSSAPAEEPEVPAEQVTDAPLVSPVQADSKPPARPLASASYEATDIEDFILNRASVCHVENIYSCLGTRFAELIKKLKEQPDPAE